MTTVEPPGRVSKLPLLIMGGVVGVAVLVTVALIAVRGPKSYDPGTPERAVQDFIEAAIDDDTDAILALLTEPARARCEDYFDDHRFDRFWFGDDFRAELEDMDVDGASATATVEFIEGGSNDPFDNSRWSHEERFDLVAVHGEWLIERAGWPHQLADCTRARR